MGFIVEKIATPCLSFILLPIKLKYYFFVKIAIFILWICLAIADIVSTVNLLI